jgi:hypothetical protein
LARLGPREPEGPHQVGCKGPLSRRSHLHDVHHNSS